MKRLTVFCMILLLCLQVFSGTVVYGAAVEGDNIVVEGYSIGSSSGIPVTEEKACEVTLKCTNTSGSAIGEIYATIDSSSSFYGNPSSSMKVCDSLDAGSDGSNILLKYPLKLVYKGTGHELKLTLKYTISGTEYYEDKELYITQVEPKNSDSGSGASAPTDTSKYVPKLGTTSTNNIPSIVAGSSLAVTYPVKNSSIYQARNITATMKMLDEAKAPLVLDNLDLRQVIDQINGNETQNVSFNIGVLSSAPEGLYALKLNYQFQSAYNDSFEQSETVYIRVKNDAVGPRLVVDNVSVKKGTSASNINLDLKLKNIGNQLAKDIKVTLKGLKSGGFTTYNSTDIKYLNKIEGSVSSTVSYQLLIPENATAGSNELSVKMEYKDAAGTAYSEENQIFVPTDENGELKPSIVIDKIVSPQEILTVNKDFQISLDLKNNGGSAKNIKVTLTTDKEIITKSLSPVYLDKLASKAAQTVTFKLFATDEAVTRNYPLAINVEYEDLIGTKYTVSQYVGVYVENGTTKTVPRIIVDKYSIDPPTVQAASDFTVKMSFLNTSSMTDVSNIKVTVSSDDGTFTPTDSGNTFYLDRIPSKKNVERELVLHVKPDAEQKSYILTVNFEYEDEKGNPFTSKETMSVRVLQNPRLVTGEISLPPETFVGQPLSIYVDFYNMGKSTLYNMMVKAEGNFQGQNLSYYVGNFESGRTDSFDTSITPSVKGPLSGNVVFSFEDANGKVTEIKKEFSVNVSEMPQQGPMLDENGIPIDMGKGGAVMVNGVPGKMPGQKTNFYILLIPAAVIIAGIITFILLRKRHKRRKEMSLDE
jgi:hypothetical protein